MTRNAEMHPDFTLQNMNIAPNPVGHSCSETFWDVLCMFTLERDYIFIYIYILHLEYRGRKLLDGHAMR